MVEKVKFSFTLMNLRIAGVLLLMILMVSCSKSLSPSRELVELSEADLNESPFWDVDIQPEFKGGPESLYQFLFKNIRIPSSAVKAGVNGKVMVQFIVEKDGSIRTAKIEESLGRECDEEALRLVKSMPHWKPGVKEGQLVRTNVRLAVVFRI